MSSGASSERSGRAGNAANWLRHIMASRTLQTVSSSLEAAGIPVLPVKGVLTAHLLYSDASERPIGDVDLRIPRRCFGQALRIGCAKGWNPQIDAPTLRTTVFKVEGHEVDVECFLGPPGLCTLSVEDLLRRARRDVGPLGFLHFEPELNDHALVLVLNAFKDGLLVTAWALEDLRRIARHDQFDAGVLVARARDGGVVSALWVVADWLVEVQHAREWSVVRDRAKAHAPRARVTGSFAFVRQRGWPSRLGLLATASASDGLLGCTRGLILTAAGVVRGRWARAHRRFAAAATRATQR